MADLMMRLARATARKEKRGLSARELTNGSKCLTEGSIQCGQFAPQTFKNAPHPYQVSQRTLADFIQE